MLKQRMAWPLSVVLGLAWLATAALADVWVSVPSGTTRDLFGIDVTQSQNGHAIGVAVGDAGTILRSADGLIWAPQTSPTSQSLRAVRSLFVNGATFYVAVGDNGTILTSNDGIAWVPRASGTTDRLNDVATDGHMIVAVGEHGTVCRSTDGVTWSVATAPISVSLRGVAAATLAHGFIIGGAAGVLLETADALSFTAIDTKQMATINSVTAARIFPGADILFVGEGGLLGRLNTGDGAMSVAITASGASLHGVNYGNVVDIPDVLFVGENGMIGRVPLTGPVIAPVKEPILTAQTNLNAVSVRATDTGGIWAAAAGNAGTILVDLTYRQSVRAQVVNFSARTTSTHATLGFVVKGAGSKSVLVRGVGPALGTFGVTPVVADPILSLYQGSTVIGGNDNWSDENADTVSAVANAVGAFPLALGSKDAALVAELPEGVYTAQITSKADGGTMLAEVYDADSTAGHSNPPRLINMSMLEKIGGAAGPLIGGFAVSAPANSGGTSLLLIRAIGPGLAQFGVASPAAQPVITIRHDGATLHPNGDLTGDTDLVATATSDVGTFPATTGDAACVIQLPAGTYTAEVTSADGASGTVLLEIYEDTVFP